MLEHDTTWTGRWVADKIEDRSDVLGIEIVESQVLKVRRENDSFMLGTTAVECVRSTVLQTMSTGALEALSFIVNIPKDSFWTGDAIALMSQYSIAFGGMSDLYRVLSYPENVREYVDKEFAFVEEVLGQHDVVETMARVEDRKYVLGRRRGMPDFTIVLLNEYELSKDHVRMAVERYRPFDAILITNPNGNATMQATEVAASMGIDIYMIKQLMGRINAP